MSEQNRQAKVLRIGIIRDGKVQEERLVDLGDDVTVGTDQGATFVVPDAKLDASQMTLFAFREGRYKLQFDNVIKGKVSVDGKPVSLDKVRRGEIEGEKDGELWSLALRETDKGKLKVGKTTLLFQFVPPPPVAVGSGGAVSFRPRLFEDEDPVFLGFLALWSALGVVFMMWVQNTEVPERTMDEIPDRFVKMVVEKPPPPEVEEETKPEVDEDLKGPQSEAGAGKPEPKPDDGPKDKPAPGSADEAQQVADAEGQMAEENELFQAAQAQLAMIGTTGSRAKGTVISDNAAGSSENIDARLRAAAEAGGGLGDGSMIRGSEGTIGGTGVRAGEGGVQAGKTGDVEVAGGPAVKAPKGSVTGGELEVDGGDTTDVRGVVRRYQGQLQYCYEQALKSDPSVRGRVVVEWEVVSERAQYVEVVENGVGDSAFAQCVEFKVKNWRFQGVDDGFVKRAWIFEPQDD